MKREATENPATRGVGACVVFFRFGDESRGSDPIVAVMRDESLITEFAAQHGRRIRYPDVYWQELPLRGAQAPYEQWPRMETVHLVTEGGIGDESGDTEIDPVALAVFAERASAEQFALHENNPNVVVREVPLDTTLPIPSWITGDPLTY